MKKILSLCCAFTLCSSLCACQQETKDVEIGGIVNPISEVTKKDFVDSVKVDVGIPENAKDVGYFIYTMDGTMELLGEVQYTLDGKEISQRAQVTEKVSFDDISDEDIEDFTGCYYEWTDTQDVEVSGLAAKAMSCDEAKVVVWLDAVPGIMFDICTTDTDVTVDDLVKIANDSFIPAQGND